MVQSMWDTLSIVGSIAFFFVCLAYVRGCEKL